jgi:hypothetical protein
MELHGNLAAKYKPTYTNAFTHNKRKICQQFLVPMAWGIHPFPFRTRKLRPTAATILGPQGPGKIARRQIQYKTQRPSGTKPEGFVV